MTTTIGGRNPGRGDEPSLRRFADRRLRGLGRHGTSSCWRATATRNTRRTRRRQLLRRLPVVPRDRLWPISSRWNCRSWARLAPSITCWASTGTRRKDRTSRMTVVQLRHQGFKPLDPENFPGPARPQRRRLLPGTGLESVRRSEMSDSRLQISCGFRPGSGTPRTTKQTDTACSKWSARPNQRDWSETTWDVSASTSSVTG